MFGVCHPRPDPLSLAIYFGANPVSPLSVRRYRADRLLRREFEAMRGRVLATVRLRLRAAGVSLDVGDIESCYSQAWHGLYTTVLEGGHAEIANPEGWLALVTYRRAIDEHRSRLRAPAACNTHDACDPAHETGLAATPERDLAGELDDRARLRQLMEGLRGRLSPRERQAAALCYLQGLSRADAATRMGISEARMRKLMEGSRAGSPGVAGKVGELLDTIRAGSYCAEQSSLMRGFAYGILNPDGERYALAIAHQRECPACRAHVLSLRGLASVLPPLPLPLGAGVAAGAGATTTGVGAGVGATTTGASAGVGVSGAGVGAGGAGGGWLVAGGGLGAKLAVGCLVAVSVGAGCVALTVGPIVPRHTRIGRRHAIHMAGSRGDQALSPSPVGAQLASVAKPSLQAGASKPASATGASGALTPAAKASREFGLERPARQVSPGVSAGSTSASSVARTASAVTSGQAQPDRSSIAQPSRESGSSSAAAREFGPG